MSSQALLIYHSRRGALEEMLTQALGHLDASWRLAPVQKAEWPSSPPERLVLAGSIQAGKLHPRLLEWARAHAVQKADTPLALITCGLMTGEEALNQARNAWGEALWAEAQERHLLLSGFLNGRRVNPLLRWMVGRLMPDPPQSIDPGALSALSNFLGGLRA